MSGRGQVARAFLIVGALSAAAAALVAFSLDAGPVWRAVFASGVVAAALFAAWKVVDNLLVRRIEALAAETKVITHGGEEARVPTKRFSGLAPLPEAINSLAEKLFAARRHTQETVAQSTLRVEEQKSRLAAILNDLHDGVLVCNLEHQILLYNRGALSLLGLGGDLGLGRNLLQFVARDPILHALERLTRAAAKESEELHAPVLTALADGRSLLQGQMGLVVTGEQVTGYVLALSDATAQLATLGKCDALLREASEGLRQPVANLRAAAETLADNPDLPEQERAAFETVILDQTQALSQRVEAIAQEYRGIAGRLWPMADMLSVDLIGLVAFRGAMTGIEVTMTGLPRRLHGDSHSLAILLGAVLDRLAGHLGIRQFDLAAESGEGWEYLDLTWTGPPVPLTTVSAWLREPLEGALENLTVADVLQLHHSDLWSEPVGGGCARLRMPLPPAVRPPLPAAAASTPRPEFFDFDLLHQPLATGKLGRTPLDMLSFVVFDTETTGLNPSGGDALISIGAVRIVNGRILTGETFSALVDPGRSIPSASIRFHGITDEMVRGRPSAAEVLPAFRAFVDDAVLVAHNAAFDLKFLKMSERAAGVRFDNPVLDTLILSRFLQGNEGDHSLDDLAQRLGVPIVDRHSAVGDAMATAAIFLRFIDMLKERDILTLDDAIRRSNMLVELRGRERAF